MEDAGTAGIAGVAGIAGCVCEVEAVDAAAEAELSQSLHDRYDRDTLHSKIHRMESQYAAWLWDLGLTSRGSQQGASQKESQKESLDSAAPPESPPRRRAKTESSRVVAGLGGCSEEDGAGGAALFAAAAEGRVADVARILGGEASLLSLREVLDSRGLNKMTGLMAAIHGGHVDAALAVLGSTPPALVDARDTFGKTALMWACEHGALRCVERLLALGAAPALLSSVRRHALMYAVEKHHADVASRLLQEPAVTEALEGKDFWGKSVLALAREKVVRAKQRKEAGMEVRMQAVVSAVEAALAELQRKRDEEDAKRRQEEERERQRKEEADRIRKEEEAAAAAKAKAEMDRQKAEAEAKRALERERQIREAEDKRRKRREEEAVAVDAAAAVATQPQTVAAGP